MNFSLMEILAAFMVLFAIIDIPGSIPIIVDIKTKSGDVHPMKVTIVSFLIFLAFLFIGSPLLGIFGVDVSSFAIAGSFIIFLIAMEMILGVGRRYLLPRLPTAHTPGIQVDKIGFRIIAHTTGP